MSQWFLIVICLFLTGSGIFAEEISGKNSNGGGSGYYSNPTYGTTVTPTGPVRPLPAKRKVNDYPSLLKTKVYPLTNLGNDPSLGDWVSKTIPQMIRPDIWTEQGGNCRISFYGPGKILVVYADSTTHKEIESFLKKVKTSLPQGQPQQPGILKTTFNPPPTIQPVRAANHSLSYPLPAPQNQPKHLFHFVIRYEGEGIIDDNVVKFYQGSPQKIVTENPFATGMETVLDIFSGFFRGNEIREMPRALNQPGSIKPVGYQSPQQTYSTPKHLFHFIIRYEGEGIIDSNVVKFYKGTNTPGSILPSYANPPCNYCVPNPRGAANSSPALPPVTSPNGIPITQPAVSPAYKDKELPFNVR